MRLDVAACRVPCGISPQMIGQGKCADPDRSTEQGVWGVGAGNIIPEGRNTREVNLEGTWGWIANDNGYGTEDTAIWGTDPGDGVHKELADLGDTQLSEEVPFNMAFDAPIATGAPNRAPGNSWVEVDIVVMDGTVSVNFNGVEFFSEESTTTDGFALLGYEDPFSSSSTVIEAREGLFGLFDNFVVKEIIPEPTSGLLYLIGMGLALLAGRRR